MHATWTEQLAGLRTLRVTVGEPRLRVVMLHGRAMAPEALAPFATSLGIAADFFVPEGPVCEGPGRAWWPVNATRRRAMCAQGPRDLQAESPAGAPSARGALLALLQHVKAQAPDHAVALIGFSQGGMLACDALLRDRAPVDALALLSSCRITAAEWETRRQALHALPVLVSHGRTDAELSFAAGEALRDLCVRGGAAVTWVPFDGGHHIPLVVWRGIRRWLQSLIVEPVG